MGFPTGKKLCFLHPQAKLSRHRGAELCRRYGRLGTTSLFISVLTGVWLVNRLYHHPSSIWLGDGVLAYIFVQEIHTLFQFKRIKYNILNLHCKKSYSSPMRQNKSLQGQPSTSTWRLPTGLRTLKPNCRWETCACQPL